MVQGLYAENLSRFSQLPTPTTVGAKSPTPHRSSTSLTKPRVLRENNVTQTKLVTKG
jgi:hypothetical protein